MWKKEIVETANGEFELFINGSGPPLCVTHLYSEFNERGNYFADAFIPHFTVYLINLRGAGGSVAVANHHEYSMSQSVQDLEAIRQALKLDTWSFAGHSTGAMIGLTYAVEAPNNLEKLVISAGAASYEYMQHPDCIYSKKNARNARLLELLSIIKSADSSLDERRAADREWMEMSLYRPENYDAYFSKSSSGKVVPARLDYFSYEELPSFNLFNQLPEVEKPILICCGKHDTQCPVDCSIHIHQALPKSELIIFKESNHSPFLEEPAAFSKMTERFKFLDSSHT
ncbi:alpha/beta fold hydrolase [Alkalicoccobacillus porphyridii]|uniref:Alpha/beta hydrolase n=1 Tax=Alkalicoccobacillus porphyridii TaxID=2597270 RepID=A0A554A1R7_9BACI|nr:alpha/beta hydrolase [Alkalicoccobacillus porphyridii]TSB47640.1 alpha/beta hydrolase [Alkalicoccobacillus porphyridii]